MLRCFGIGEALPRLAFPVATLGTFDGVHLGHQRVIGETTAWAKRERGSSVVITFDRHPRRVIMGQAPALITSVEHRLALLEALGVDVAIVLHFDAALAELTAEDFVRNVLVDWLHVRGVMLGFDCAFGKGRRGDAALLERMGAANGFVVRVCPRVEAAGTLVSSTAVRKAIEQGALDTASQMLGRPFSMLGAVVHGSGKGRSLGFPTANLDLYHEAKPPDGVYLTQARVRGKAFLSLTSIGIRPTFHSQPQAKSVVEVYIEGIDESIYGEEIEVQFVRKLREQVKFGDIEGLKRQMARDREVMLAELAGQRPGE